jgi:hypothetical protein
MKPIYRIRQILIITIVLLSASLSFSQPPEVEWTRTFGGDSTDVAWSVQQTRDGGYIFAGETQSFGAIGYRDVLVVRINSNGIADWYQLYGGIGNDIAYTVLQAMDGDFVVLGFTTSWGAGGSDMYVAKLDNQGDTLWTRVYGGQSEDRARCGQQTDDAGYIFAGLTRMLSGTDWIFMVKTDSLGDTLWTRAYGGTNDITIWSVRQTNDGGYILAGYIEYDGMLDYDYYVARTDSMGDTLWTRTYGGEEYDWARSVQPTFDGGFIIAGTSYSFGAGVCDMYVVKTDSSGDTLWTHTYGGIYGESAYSILPLSDGGFAIAGGTSSFGVGPHNIYLVRINAQGDTLWTLAFGDEYRVDAYSMALTDDGGYIVAGTIQIPVEPEGTQDDCFLAKTGPDTSATHAPSIEWVSHPLDFALHPAYPNPFNPTTTISFDLPFQNKISMNIYNILGQRVAVLMNGYALPGTHRLLWDASDLPSGVYFVTLESGESVQTRKVVLLK